jgi:aminoglycoside 6-adenylyltransferase
MRNEKEMLQLILDTARQDERIRAVIMNGSRADPNAPRDIFQDFDIVYVVTDPAPFRNNYEWIKRFGELMILQEPDDMHDPPAESSAGFGYLMQFTDGNRIDLNIFPLTKVADLRKDTSSLLLLDKDGLMGAFPPADESGYLPNPPTAKQFSDCTNEFWWCCPYVAKGLWREELPYAKAMLDGVVREQLMKMLAWHIGMRTDFKVNPGKFGKHFQKHLAPEVWDLLLRTYSGPSYDATWYALLTMGELFRKVAVPVAEHFGFSYPFDDDRRVTAHLEHVRRLPKDAKEMYGPAAGPAAGRERRAPDGGMQ